MRAASAGVEQLSDDDLERLIVYALLFGNAVSADEDDDDGEADGVAAALCCSTNEHALRDACRHDVRPEPESFCALRAVACSHDALAHECI